MIHRIATGHDSQQHLSRTNVRRCFFAPNVLLAGLQGHSQSRLTLGIHRNTNDAPRNMPFQRIAGSEKGRVWPPEAHRNAKPLCRTHYHIGPHFAGRSQHRQSQQISRNGYRNAQFVGSGNQVSIVKYLPIGGRVLQEHSEQSRVGQVGSTMVAHQYRDSYGRGPRVNQVDSLGMAMRRHEKCIGVFLIGRSGGMKQTHGFGSGCCLIEQRRIGQIHARQVGDYRLEIEQGFQPSLGNFGLIGRVGRVPGRVFQNIPKNNVGRNGIVITLPDVRSKHLVLPGQFSECTQKLSF